MYKSKNEQLSTWMDWIWSWMCLELFCTSTQSTHLKWVSVGGINSPRHQTSRWLTSTENSTIRWSDAIFSRASIQLVPLPCHVAVEIPRHNCSGAILQRYVRSSGAEGLASKSPLLASNWLSDRPTLTLTKASGHPVLKAFSWRVSVWIQTERRIDRRGPHLDRRIIRCYCLHCSSSATRPTLLGDGPSVHPTVPRVWPCVPTRPTIAPTLVFEGPSVHPTVSFLFLFLLGFDPLFCSFLHVVFLHPWDLEMSTKTCSDNKVSPNDHVVMNHQNQTRTNGIWGHVLYNGDDTTAALCALDQLVVVMSWGPEVRRDAWVVEVRVPDLPSSDARWQVTGGEAQEAWG
jgi:hypothetical protein